MAVQIHYKQVARTSTGRFPRKTDTWTASLPCRATKQVPDISCTNIKNGTTAARQEQQQEQQQRVYTTCTKDTLHGSGPLLHVNELQSNCLKLFGIPPWAQLGCPLRHLDRIGELLALR